jgi:hypothetical protein
VGSGPRRVVRFGEGGFKAPSAWPLKSLIFSRIAARPQIRCNAAVILLKEFVQMMYRSPLFSANAQAALE